VCIIPHFGRFLKIAAVVDFTAFQRFQGSTGRTSLDVQFQQIFAHLFLLPESVGIACFEGTRPP
jgi:hypothetical protein